ncbi:unnamed protein product, partial [Mesorhabditis spiculigera]
MFTLLDGALPRPLDVRGAGRRQVVQRHLGGGFRSSVAGSLSPCELPSAAQRGENVTLSPTAVRRNTTGESAPGVAAEPAEQLASSLHR